MTPKRRTRSGFTLGELLVACAVLMLFFGITWAIYGRARSKTAEDIDVQRMRRIFVALSMYEDANNGAPAPNLLTVRRDLAGDEQFRSESDPWAQESFPAFPADPEMPAVSVNSPIRISFAYLTDFIAAGNAQAPAWPAARLDQRVALLSCSWHGSIEPTGAPFTVREKGAVLRIQMDGALFRAPDPGGDGTMGDVQRLFLRR